MIAEQRTEPAIANRPVSRKNPKIKMEMLLQESGFATRGRRADCLHCAGSSRFTVSFTDDLAFCHRCHWKANAFTLARQLGLLTTNCRAAAAFQAEQLTRRRFRGEIEAFEKWLSRTYWYVANEYRQLGQAAERAKSVLAGNPSDEAAWAALANFYHPEAMLTASLDYLVFAKASQWLESDLCPTDIFRVWRQENATA